MHDASDPVDFQEGVFLSDLVDELGLVQIDAPKS